MKTLIFFAMIWKFSLADASDHRSHHAHVHGNGTLAIAFEGSSGKVEFKAPAESVVGFEHKASSKADQAVLAETLSKFEKDIAKWVQFETSLSCKIKKDHVAMEAEGSHADFVANYTVACLKPVHGTRLIIDFTSFPKLADLDITILIGDLQKTAEAQRRPITVELK